MWSVTVPRTFWETRLRPAIDKLRPCSLHSPLRAPVILNFILTMVFLREGLQRPCVVRRVHSELSGSCLCKANGSGTTCSIKGLSVDISSLMGKSALEREEVDEGRIDNKYTIPFCDPLWKTLQPCSVRLLLHETVLLQVSASLWHTGSRNVYRLN